MNYTVYLLSALGLGALHALEPGHGKSIMGAYLVMSRGRARDAVFLGLASALTHTLVIVIMAVLAKSAAVMAMTRIAVSPARFELWLRLISGLIIILVGLRLFRRKEGCSCGHHHPHGPDHDHNSGLHWQQVNTGDLIMLGFTNGLMPCPSALAILLLSIGSGTIVTGLSLVFAFGLGGAIALIGIGLIFVKVSSLAGGVFSQRSWTKLYKLSGALILLIGFFTAFGAMKNLL